MANESSPLRWHPSKLVLLRLWSEQNAGEGEQLCGKIQFVVSGEAVCFQGGEQLIALLSEMLRRTFPPMDGEAC